MLVVLAVAGVARHGARCAATSPAADADASARDELEARKEHKYREIRDAEMDFRTGKLSEADWRALDRELRAEAIEILRELDALEALGAASRRPRLVPWAAYVLRACRRPGLHRRRPRLPDPAALGQGRGDVRRLRRRRRAAAARGGSLMERNLTRWTIAFAVLFVVNTFVLLKI